MTAISPSPRLHFDDLNGKPLSGGSLWTYLSGGASFVQTFTDFTGTVKNPVKIPLDARGECNVWLDDDTVYYYSLHDSMGMEIYNVDGISGHTGSGGSVAEETARAEAAEAAAKTEVVAGSNTSVSKAVAADGHSIYTVSTGQTKYSLSNNNSTTDQLYAKVATCDPYRALQSLYGWITGTFIATEFNGAVTIFAMNIERATNGQAYSGDINAYFEGRNLSAFSYANTSNIEEIRLYEGATPHIVELWVKLKSGYRNCQTSFAVLENDAISGSPLSTNPWTLVANPERVNAWPSGMTNRLSLTHTDNQVKSLAYLDTQITPGDNITISETTDAYGKHKYTITGSAPAVNITSVDGSVDVSETSTPTSKTIDLSVKSRISNFIGNFTSAELPTESGIYLQMSKSSGTLLNSSSAITVPAGTYHISLMLQADCAAYQQNVNDNGIIVYDTGVLNTFYFHTDPSSGLTQSFTIAYDRTFSASTQLQFFGKADLAGWTLSGKVWIHAVANATTGGTGGGLSDVAHDDTLSGDGTTDNPLSVVGGGDTYEVKVNSAGTAGYLYDKVNTEVPIQKKVENDQLVIYQDPVQASPLSMLSTPSVDNVLSTINVVTNGTMQLSWIAIQAHAFTVPNYYTPDITDIWNYININTQGASAEGVHFVGIYAYDLTTNTIHLVCMSVNGASHDNTATGIASLATGYVNTATGYNIIKPGLIYYAFHACDQTALTVAGNSSSTFNLSQPYPSLILYNLSNGLTVTDFVTNYGTIDLSTSTLSHQESAGKRFLAVRHAT